MPKSIDELGEELCRHCSCTEHGTEKANTSLWNLCEGINCKEAYENYLEEYEEENE